MGRVGKFAGLFGEMCSYKVRNVNLNFGGGIWAGEVDGVVTPVLDCYREIKGTPVSVIRCPP